ncbi:MFS transporter [Aerophototrophica crusticola]|uniref:MFS transporter n=1 Tax=Aerophototrophica crusticola TaxID=1709002 RepID=A0A858R395_9PROT|nr:MFS transporter [Rhodospirillaceae bacterium B3]
MTAVQFVSVLSFMVVMPLGPDMSQALGFSPSLVGWVTASYTLTAAVSGIAAALVLDRFDRRPALGLCMLGLVASNVAAGLAWSLEALVAARVMAGLFGGPAGALAVAIVADNVPPERRGQAMGTVMGAISLSAVLGVPGALEVGHRFGWPAPFFSVAALSLVIVLGSLAQLPPQRHHLNQEAALPTDITGAALRLLRMGSRPLSLLAFTLAAVAILPGFLVITNLAVFVQFNLGFPREQLGLLYMIGGGISFFGMRWTGRLVDRFGSTPVTTVSTLVLAALLYVLYFDWHWLALPVLGLVPAFMFFNTARMVAQNTAVSKVPEPAERAGFMALVQAVTQIAGGAGSALGAAMLTAGPDGKLAGMPALALIGILVSLAGPPLMAALERRIPRSATESHRVKAVAAKGSGVGG